MALAFLTDGEVADAELVIRLDFDGLHTLLKSIEAALQARLEPVAPEGADPGGTVGGEAANAFGKVTFEFVTAPQSDARDPVPG